MCSVILMTISKRLDWRKKNLHICDTHNRVARALKTNREIMSIKKIVAVSVVSLFGLVGCGGGSSGSKGGSSSSPSQGGSSSSPVVQHHVIDVVDGGFAREFQVKAGDQLQYILDRAFDGVQVSSVSGCGQTAASVFERLGMRNISWVPTSNCKLEISYSRAVADGNFVTLKIDGYGSYLKDLGVDLIYVDKGKVLSLPLSLKPGYEARGFGCGGSFVPGGYVTSAIEEDCEIELSLMPIMKDQSVKIHVNFDGSLGGQSGSETLEVIGASSIALDMGNSIGFVPVVTGNCPTGRFYDVGGIPQGQLAITAPRSGECTLSVSYVVAPDHKIVAFVGESDGYRSYVTRDFYTLALRRGTHLALASGQSGVIRVIPNPGFSIGNVDGCRADNRAVPTHFRTGYFGDENHGVSDCAVSVEVLAGQQVPTTDVEVRFQWDLPADPKVGNIKLPRLNSAWKVVNFADIGVSDQASAVSYSAPGLAPCHGLIAINRNYFLLGPVLGNDARCGVELQRN